MADVAVNCGPVYQMPGGNTVGDVAVNCGPVYQRPGEEGCGRCSCKLWTCLPPAWGGLQWEMLQRNWSYEVPKYT